MTNTQITVPKRCAVYTRKSANSRLDHEVKSLGTQHEICSSYIASQRYRGWAQLEKSSRSGSSDKADISLDFAFRPSIGAVTESRHGNGRAALTDVIGRALGGGSSLALLRTQRTTQMTKTEPTTHKPRRMAREPQNAENASTAGKAVADGAADQQVAPLPDETALSVEPKRKSKQDLVIELLRRKDGASLTDLVEATGWLPHTARAALTGLKKKGHKIIAAKVDKVTRYTITGE